MQDVSQATQASTRWWEDVLHTSLCAGYAGTCRGLGLCGSLYYSAVSPFVHWGRDCLPGVEAST